MKNTLQLFCLGLFMVTLSSCDTYVNGGGYVGARPGYYHPAPPYYAGRYNNRYYNHPSYYRAPSAPPGYYRRPAGVGVNARVNTGRLLNLNSSTGLGIY